ncbi:zinc finger protein VAR3, chloroplastic [Asparagus officinalis]|uniref:zinc finger protein VAR3, chloroplastic n=1 Tax=Asparagus officinalis TaxID=4686 RepID=UPI00098E1998|nr:zinc finger protein VAR3, chloroplastic [Asparagus officinalis]
MRNKGYFAKTMEESSDAASPSSSYSAAAMDLNRVKNACLSFARERYDIIKSLPKEDIQTVVECGCPNLFRKAVNSAKRLRAFLRLDEGDVCGACNLRGSCDRAYTIEKDGDKARTVDIMRILMTYAVDPALHSGGTNPSMTEHVQESARKLLTELIKLSDTTIDPALPKSEVLSKKKESSEKSREVITKSKHSEHSNNVEMKRGDWMCSNCNFLNFARNIRCLECKADGPKRVEPTTLEMKLGDWTCPKCEFMNFARNKKCHRCQEFRPKRELNPGEWECPKCDFVNFRRNTICKKCNCERPAYNEAGGFDDHVWKNPRTAKIDKVLKFRDNKNDLDFDDDEIDAMLPDYGEKRVVTGKTARR